MIDKVQKIYEEVVRMHNLLPVMDGDNISVNYADRICTTLEMYIDSLQEEPVDSIWHDASENPSPDELIITERGEYQPSYSVERGIHKEKAIFHDIFGDFEYYREAGNKPQLIRWCRLSDLLKKQ